MLVITARRKFRQLAYRNQQALLAQRLRGIGIINPGQLQNDHFALIRPDVLNTVLSMFRAKIDDFELLKAIGDIGEQAHLQLAPNAKKGHHLSNSSPFGLFCFWHVALELFYALPASRPERQVV